MSYDDDERSVSQNRPIDLYTITTPTVTYRLTSYITDVVYAGNTYTALTMSRGNLQVGQDLTGRELVVYLPIDHPFVQRYTASGIPEHGIVVTLQRLQQVSGVAIQQWSGFAQSMAIDGHTALVRVPSVTDDAMKIKLPVVRAQVICNHVLYDTQCTIDRTLFALTAVIVSQSGSTLGVSSLGGKPDMWAQFGEVVHGSGQRRLCASQVGTTLTLDAPFVGAATGDGLTVFAGCAHDVVTCRDKFANVVNFGGMPTLNGTVNPWAVGGLGLIRQV